MGGDLGGLGVKGHIYDISDSKDMENLKNMVDE